MEKLLAQHFIPIPHSTSLGGAVQYTTNKWTKGKNYCRKSGRRGGGEEGRRRRGGGRRGGEEEVGTKGGEEGGRREGRRVGGEEMIGGYLLVHIQSLSCTLPRSGWEHRQYGA